MKHLFFTAMTLISWQALAASLNMADDIKIKADLEKVISERYIELIATRLPRSEFQVSATVRLEKRVAKPKVEKRLPEKEPAPHRELADVRSVDNINAPTEMTLGMINAETLLANQQEEIRALRARLEDSSIQKNFQPIINIATPPPNEDKTFYRVQGVKLVVGLASSLPDAYVQSFKLWLDRQVRSEFEGTGTTDVGLLRPEPKVEPKAEPTPAPREVPAPKSNLTPAGEWARSLQNFAGLFFLACAILITAGIWRSTKLRTDTEKQTSVRIENAGGEALPQKKSQDAADSLEALPAPPTEVTLNSTGAEYLFERWLLEKRKLRPLMEEMRDKLALLVRSWIEGGGEGQVKAAVFIDALAFDDEGRTSWDLPIPPEYSEVMTSVFKSMALQPLEEKIKIVESIYWDVIGLKTLRNQPQAARFSFLSSVPKAQLEIWFEQASASAKGLTLLFLATDIKSVFLEALSAAERQTVLGECIAWGKADDSEIGKMEKVIHAEIRDFQKANQPSRVNENLMVLLSSLTLVEELKLWPQLVVGLSDGGRELRKQKPTLAFFSEWSFNARQLMFQDARLEDINAFLQVRPDFWDAMIEVCPPRVVEMLGTDRHSQNSVSVNESQIELNLRRLQNRLANLIDKKMVKKDELLPSVVKGPELAAA